MRKLRQEHPALERKAKSAKITEMLVATKEWQQAKTILLYYPKDGEVDTKEAIDAGLSKKKMVCLPSTDKKSGTITAYKITCLENLQTAAFGIPEPKKEQENEIAPEKIDLIIVPGIAFDVHANRVGHGHGYYDKFLAAANNAKKVALAFDFQVVPEKIVCESHDVTVDQIITEKRHIVVKK
jgi:5-formyltetrahydrofolate cyclo-ligase